jgi:hypothetical protein
VLDFTELSEDGNEFELLTREMLSYRGLNPRWSGKGSDGGRDLLVDEVGTDLFGSQHRTWLVSCKQKADGVTAVRLSELDGLVEACKQLGATGFLLVCSSYPSSGAARRLEELAASGTLHTHYWDGVTIERLLFTPRGWPTAQRFFPRSGNRDGWQLWATTLPNRYVVNARGFYFQLAGRIGGSWVDGALDGVREALEEISRIPLGAGEELRPRAVWYDDKNGAYVWYLDMLVPMGQEPSVSVEEVGELLGPSDVPFNDGQIYSWDVAVRPVDRGSDRYDPDAASFYEPFQGYYDFAARR